MGEKTRETIFPETQEWCDQKMLGKNQRKYVRKNVFLYSHKYRDQKSWGKKRAKQFFQKHTNGALKKCWEKTVAKMCEITFFIFTQIS